MPGNPIQSFLVLHSIHLNDLFLGFAENIVFFPDLNECCKSLVEVVLIVTCGQLSSNASLPLRYNGEEEPDGINALPI